MIYTSMVNKAIKFAYKAHEGQVDKAGLPYILHPYHLAEQMDDEISCVVALLHDVVEDTECTLEDLSKIFPSEVIAPLALLTHADGVDYFEYVKAIKSHQIAKKVKLADLAHNSNPNRIVGMNLSDQAVVDRMNKYVKAKAILTE